MKCVIVAAVILKILSLPLHVVDGSLVDRVTERIGQYETPELSFRNKVLDERKDTKYFNHSLNEKAQKNSKCSIKKDGFQIQIEQESTVPKRESKTRKTDKNLDLDLEPKPDLGLKLANQVQALERLGNLVEVPIWELDGEAIDKLTAREKEEYTRDLTAEQWNRVLSKFSYQIEEIFDDNFGVYIKSLDENKRIELMTDALKNNYWLLLSISVRYEYVPANRPELKGLLEESIRKSTDCPKYLNVRLEALHTLYRLGSPPEGWYFTSSEENLGLVFFLIQASLLPKNHVVNHLIDIVDRDSNWRSLIDMLIEEKVLTTDDICSLNQCLGACKIGSVEYLKRVKDFCSALSVSQECIRAAAMEGHVSIIEFLSHLTTPVLPTQDDVDWAAISGHVNAVKVFTELSKPMFPTQRAVSLAESKGYDSVITFLSQLRMPMFSTQQGVD